MKFLLKSFFITFALIQAVQAGRYYNTENGRFISRDPIVNPQNPLDIMILNDQRAAIIEINQTSSDPVPFNEPNGYHDGMSLYNAYFAENFGLDPSGKNGLDGTGWQQYGGNRAPVGNGTSLRPAGVAAIGIVGGYLLSGLIDSFVVSYKKSGVTKKIDSGPESCPCGYEREEKSQTTTQEYITVWAGGWRTTAWISNRIETTWQCCKDTWGGDTENHQNSGWKTKIEHGSFETDGRNPRTGRAETKSYIYYKRTKKETWDCEVK